MKKIVFASALLISGIASAAQIEMPKEMYVYQVCEALPQLQLPNGCVATCKKEYNESYTLKLTQGSKSTEVNVSYTARASRTVENDIMKIEGGVVGGEYLYVLVNRNDQVLALTLNDLECK